MQNYGVKFSLPSMYVLDANIFNKNPRYSFQLIKWCLPKEKDFMIQTHNVDGTSELGYYDEMFADFNGCISLRLNYQNDKFFEKIEEHIFENCDKAISKFSPDSKMFAIMVPVYKK